MSRIVILYIFGMYLSVTAITKSELEILEPLLYHPIKYNTKGYPDGY